MARRLLVMATAVVLVFGVIVGRAGIASASPGNIIYVSSTGSDVNDCSTPTDTGEGIGPCATIAHTVSRLSNADYSLVLKIDVAPGTYVENNPIQLNGTTVPDTGLTITCPTCSGPTVATVEPFDSAHSLFATGGSGVSFHLDNLHLQGATAASPGPADGGALDNTAQGASPNDPGVTLANDVLSGFGVTQDGGAVDNENGGVLVLDGTTVTGNTAGSQGGGIFNQGNLTVTDSSTVSDNQVSLVSDTQGGGIASVGLNDADFPTSVTIDGSTVTGNSAGDDGGGVYAVGSSLDMGSFTPEAPLVRLVSPRNVSPIDSSVTGNTSADGDGGGVYADDGNGNNTISVSDTLIAGNTSTAGNGGGVWLQTTQNSATFQSDIVSGNTAPEGDGGGVWSEAPSNLGAQFTDDVVGSAAAPALPSACPAAASTAADAANSAMEGGGLYLTGDDGSQPMPSITGSTIDGNCASSQGGGGVYVGLSGAVIQGSTLAANESTGGGDGGGLLADDGDPVQVTDSTIANNEVVGAKGGGIASEDHSVVSLLYSTVIGNLAAPAGSVAGAAGGIYDPQDASFALRPAVIPAGATLDNCSDPASFDAGGNLEDDLVPQCFHTDADTANVIGQDPGLGTLAFNPGVDDSADVAAGIPYPPTAIPGQGSPALGTGGTNCGAFAPDELGNNRSAPCDMGAVQVTPPVVNNVRPFLVLPRIGASGLDSRGSIVASNFDVPVAVVGPPVGPPPGPPVVTIGGPGRDETSVLTSQTEFPKGAKAVVLARSDLFPDALTGVPFAVAKGAPLLLTGPVSLDPAVAAEIQRVLAPGGTVYLLGLTNGLSANVESQVKALGFNTVRLGGTTRFDTAVDIAQALGNPGVIFEADGADFPDALSGVSAATLLHGAILLTSGSSQNAATAAYLAASPSTRYALGGPAAAADPSAAAIVGPDRFSTSALVASQFFPHATQLGAATGTNFPDAMTGGALEAALGAPMTLVDPTWAAVSQLPTAVATYLASLRSTLTGITVFGGTAAVPAATVATLQSAVG